MPGLDGLRGVAVIAVLVYHLEPTWLPGGFIGVDVFFVLSGFLIASLLLRERQGTGRIDLVRFFTRRLRRLMPAVLVLLAALALYSSTWAEPVELDRLRRHGLGTLAYVTNWIFVADGTTYTDILVGASPLRHVWSLAIEEQLYLVLVAFVAGAASIGSLSRLRQRFGVLAGFVAIASAAWMAWLSTHGASVARTYFGTDTRAQTMLVGAVLGAVLVGRPTAPRSLVRVGGWVGLGVLVVVAFAGAEDALWLHRGGFLLVALAAGALVVASASDPTMRSVMAARPLVAVGTVSYGLYLWHWPVLVVFDEQRTGLDGFGLTLLRLVISVVAATVSSVVVEQPIRSGLLGQRFGRRAFAPALAGVALVVVGLVASTTVSADISTSAAPAQTTGPLVPGGASEPVPSTASSNAASPNPAPSNSVSAPPTTIAARQAVPLRVAVIGDSVMHTVIGGQVGSSLDFTPWTPDQTTFDPALIEVTSIAKPACSFLPFEVAILEPNGSYGRASLDQFCDDWRSELDAALGALDLVVLQFDIDMEDRWVDGALLEFGSPGYFELLGGLLDDITGRAAAADVPVLLLAAAPRLAPGWPEPVGEREAKVADFYESWVETHEGVSTLDLGELVCPDRSCLIRTMENGEQWRYDNRHYTAAGASTIATWLTPQLIQAAELSG